MRTHRCSFPALCLALHYRNAAFLVASGDYPTCHLAGKSPEPWALVCCATLPFEVALYAISVRRLIALHSDFLQTVPRCSASRSKSGGFDLSSATTFVTMINTLTGFAYRGLPLP